MQTFFHILASRCEFTPPNRRGEKLQQRVLFFGLGYMKKKPVPNNLFGTLYKESTKCEDIFLQVIFLGFNFYAFEKHAF